MTGGPLAPRRPTRILLVADDSRGAMIIMEMLRAGWPEGLLIIHTRSVADAIQEVSEPGISCALLELPGHDRTASLEPLTALINAAPEVPVIVLSDGEDDDRRGLAAVQAGAQDHLRVSELQPAHLARGVRYAIERKRAEVALGRQALQDPLTELPNRALFDDRLTVALDRARRTGRAPALMFLDLDAFKTVNDTLGHAAGDELLCTLADRFRALLRPMDTVARIGGDEFTFLFEGLSGRDEALAIASRVAEAAALPVLLHDHRGEVAVSASIGITMVADSESTLQDALRDADAAMYRAKGAGGARAELFDDGPRPRGSARSSAEAALRTAIRTSQLRLDYQPRVSLNDRTGLVGFEALVRWNHPDQGLIAPADFIPLAEQTGLIAPLGDWVMEQALHQVHRWRQSRPEVTISVNLSPRQLADPHYATRLGASLERLETDPEVVWLEVPESAVRGDGVSRALHRLSEVGVRLTIDDFGGDGSAVPSLRELPIHTVKLDARLVAGLAGDDRGAMVAAAVELGHAFGLDVIAKGVETDVQLAQLRDLGCDGAQGFLFSQPVPGPAIGELLGAV